MPRTDVRWIGWLSSCGFASPLVRIVSSGRAFATRCVTTRPGMFGSSKTMTRPTRSRAVADSGAGADSTMSPTLMRGDMEPDSMT